MLSRQDRCKQKAKQEQGQEQQQLQSYGRLQQSKDCQLVVEKENQNGTTMKRENTRCRTISTASNNTSLLRDDWQQEQHLQKQVKQAPTSLMDDDKHVHTKKNNNNNNINLRTIRSIALIVLCCGIVLHIYFVLIGGDDNNSGSSGIHGDRAQRQHRALLLGILDHDHPSLESGRTDIIDDEDTDDDNDHNTLLSGPIIVMGLPNSGSIAIHNYFQCRSGGSVSQHYCCDSGGTSVDDVDSTQFPCRRGKSTSKATETTTKTGTCGECVLNNMKERRPPFDGCHSLQRTSIPSSSSSIQVEIWSSFDVETQDEWFLPQHFAIGLLQESYPNATWILNKRSSSKIWAQSILHWHSKTRRIFASYQLPLHPYYPVMSSSSSPLIATSDHQYRVVSQKEILHDMDRVLLENIYNETEYIRKVTLLQQLYEDHTKMIRTWAQQFPLQQQEQYDHQRRRPLRPQERKLWEINVDDNPGSILKILEKVIPYTTGSSAVLQPPQKDEGSKNDNSNTKSSFLSCDWTYTAPDKDWEDFNLPF
jgi:hypothetical protein